MLYDQYVIQLSVKDERHEIMDEESWQRQFILSMKKEKPDGNAKKKNTMEEMKNLSMSHQWTRPEKIISEFDNESI